MQGSAPNEEPLDTIFVKKCSAGEAFESGLRVGDRLVAVNGVPVISYAQVVAAIRTAITPMELLVVPQKDDILQSYFSEIAQNESTNQRPAAGASPAAAAVAAHFARRSRDQQQPHHHVYAVPALIRQETSANSSMTSSPSASWQQKQQERFDFESEMAKRHLQDSISK